ncbi:MAG TPA: hypothetical protein VFW96_28040 [Thermomicrobiales bacterium]|nr:hypothetical protein [Thermomicrobiales bacterium]
MQVIDVRDRRPDRHADRPVQEILDDGAVSAYRVACVHEARAVVEVVLGHQRTLLCCAECGTPLGVIQRAVA